MRDEKDTEYGDKAGEIIQREGSGISQFKKSDTTKQPCGRNPHERKEGGMNSQINQVVLEDHV